MRDYLQVGLASFLFCVVALNSKCNSQPEAIQSQLVVAAIVEAIGKHPGVTSGFHQIYQLAKYRVVAVCAGTYEQKEIVVDHLLISGDELKSLRIGERVYLTLSPTNAIPLRFNEERFRKSSESVETFYIDHTPEIIKPAACKE